MPSSDQDEIVARYIERLSELEADPAEPDLDAEKLAAIAVEVGIDEEQLALAEREVSRRLEEARSLASDGPYAEADLAVRVAADLAPFSAQPKRVRFEVALSRYLVERTEPAAEACQRSAEAALAAAPDDETLRAEVRAFRKRRQLAPPAARRSSAAGWVAGLGLAGLIAGLGTVWLLADSGPEESGSEPGVWVPPAEVREVRSGKPTQTATATARQTGPRQVPVELVTTAAVEGLAIITHASVLDVYPDSAFYRLKLEWENRTAAELHQLAVRVELLDASGEVAHVETAEPVADRDEPLRPGERRPFRALVRASERVHAARVVVTLGVAQPGAASYPAGPALPLAWDVPRPPGVDLALRQRAVAHRRHGFSGTRHFHELVFEVANQGAQPIQVLKLEIRYSDEAGQPLRRDATWLATSDGPPLRPGVTWTGRTVEILPTAVGGFTLAVIDVR